MPTSAKVVLVFMLPLYGITLALLALGLWLWSIAASSAITLLSAYLGFSVYWEIREANRQRMSSGAPQAKPEAVGAGASPQALTRAPAFGGGPDAPLSEPARSYARVDNEALETRLRNALVEAAARRETPTYKQVAQPLGLNWRSRYFHQVLLGGISAEEYREGRPLLTAIVVRQDTGRPGDGFFDNARGIGAYDGHDDMGFWRTEVNRVWDYWAR